MDVSPDQKPIAPPTPPGCPKVRPNSEFRHDGRNYRLSWEDGEWRLRVRRKGESISFRTGCHRLPEAKAAARQYLERRSQTPMHSKKGGGTLAALTAIYSATPKRTKATVAKDNVSRLRSICRLTVGRDIDAVTCLEIGPDFWQQYQRKALAAAGHDFDLTTRHRENIRINAAVRAARCLFLPALLPHYRASGLDVRPDAGNAVMLPEPYVPPSDVDDGAIIEAWRELPRGALWATVGLARFAGLRREEIAAARPGWLDASGPAASVVMRDRPEEKWWTKTGKPYRAQVIDAELAEWLLARPDGWLVPDPPDGSDRSRWFEREPQRWLRQWIPSGKPLHRLRGLYADAVAALTSDAVAARLAGLRAAADALGHTTTATTERHYVTPEGCK
jgi:integrase